MFSDGNDRAGWESNRICMSPKQTPKAMLTLRCYGYEIAERVRVNSSDHLKKLKTSRHNDKGLMLRLCVVLPGYKIRHDVLLMRKITACVHGVNY